jgi:hypothetical protein
LEESFAAVKLLSGANAFPDGRFPKATWVRVDCRHLFTRDGSMRVLSGIQPTGRPHWGNYFGAIRQYIQLQTEDEAYFFIANLHALTTIRDPKLLQQLTWDAALDLLALGLNPNQAILFVQSTSLSSELCWLDDRNAVWAARTMSCLQGEKGKGLSRTRACSPIRY